jgi:imidazolonepropionase
VEGKSGYGLNLHQELRALRLLGEVGEELGLTVRRTLLAAHDVPDEYRERREDYVSLVCREIIPAVAAEGLAEAADVFCETGVFSVAESRVILQAARERGLRLRLHADQLSASGGSLLAAELGAVSADHLEEIDDRGIFALREKGVVAVMLPGSTYFLGMKNYAPARKLLDSGVSLALATNYNPGSSMFISLPNIMNMAAVHQHLKPAEAFWAATRGGALVLGLEERKGRLTPGGDADVLVWKDAASLEEIVYQPNIQPDLVFTGGRVRRDLC